MTAYLAYKKDLILSPKIKVIKKIIVEGMSPEVKLIAIPWIRTIRIEYATIPLPNITLRSTGFILGVADMINRGMKKLNKKAPKWLLKLAFTSIVK